MKPRKGALSTALRRWAKQAPPNEARDVLIRLMPGADPVAAANRLAELGANVEQQARTVVVARATGAVVLAASHERWVLGIEEPHPLLPR